MEPKQGLEALVLAGGVNRIPLFEGYVPGYKALLPLGERPAIQYTLEALWSTPEVERVTIVGSEADLAPVVASVPARGPVRFIPGGKSLLESVLHGLRACAGEARVLVATADLPLLTSTAIRDFLTAAAETSSPWRHNLRLAVVPQRCYTGQYAHFTKPFNPFHDISVCHGNLALVEPAVVENVEAMHHLDELYRSRKNPLFCALSVGLFVGFAYIFGVQILHALTLDAFARAVSGHLRMGVIPVLINHPEVTIDVDDADDYRFVLEHLHARVSAGIPQTAVQTARA